MSPKDKFCLKWNDFQKNISSTFQDLFNVDDFTDVTLACDDDEFVESHKIVLSASSPFFMKILQKTKLQNPLIYLRGIKSKDLTNILEFMYHGQVNVYEEDLQHFLALAQELQLKGLGGMEKQGDNGPEVMKKNVACKTNVAEIDHTFEDQSHKLVNNLGVEDRVIGPGNVKREETEPEGHAWEENNEVGMLIGKDLELEDNSSKLADVNIDEIETVDYSWTGNSTDLTDVALEPVMQLDDSVLEQLDQQITSMMVRGEDNKWTCTVCGKKANKGQNQNLRVHIEANHLAVIPHPCSVCGKTFK